MTDYSLVVFLGMISMGVGYIHAIRAGVIKGDKDKESLSQRVCVPVAFFVAIPVGFAIAELASPLHLFMRESLFAFSVLTLTWTNKETVYVSSHVTKYLSFIGMIVGAFFMGAASAAVDDDEDDDD